MSDFQDWQQNDGDGDTYDFVAQLLAVGMNPVGIFRRRWPWMLLAVVLGIAATTYAVVSIEPTYKANSSVLVSGQQIPQDFVRSTVREDSLSNINAMVGEVLSQKNLSQLIEKHGLYRKELEAKPDADMVSRMRAAVTINPQMRVNAGRGQNSRVFNISFEYEDARRAADVANELASILINVSIANRSEQARTTTEFLRRELERAQREYNEVSREVSDFQRENRGQLPGDQVALLRRLERIQAQQESITNQITELDRQRAAILSEEDQLSTQQDMVAQLRMQLAAELGIHTEEHPNVIALKRRIELMTNELGELTAMLDPKGTSKEDRVREIEEEITALQQEKTQLEQESSLLDARVDQIPVREQELGGLQQRVGVARENYLEFLRKVQDAELAQTLESAQQGPKVSVLDRARPPSAPVQAPISVLLPALLVTVALGIGVGVGLELLDPVVLSVEQFDGVTNAPLLGSLHRMV